MQQRALDNPKIEVLWGQNVTDVFDVSAGKVNGLELTATETGEKKRVPADGLFLAIGHKPNTARLPSQLPDDQVVYVISHAGKNAPDIPGSVSWLSTVV